MVEELKTGRSLDVAVAKTVMGREVIWSAAIYGDWMDRTSGRSDVHVSPYSTDIAAAMKVVDHLRTTYPVTLWCNANYFVVQVFSGREGDAQDLANISAPTLPEAICRAALKATECLSISDRGTDGQASETTA